MPLLAALAHHSEPTDPLLLRWLVDTVEAVAGLAPVVVAVAAVLLAFPITLLVLAGLRLRRDRSRRQ